MRNTMIAGGATLVLFLICLLWMGFLSIPSQNSSWAEAIPSSSMAVLETKQLDLAVNELYSSSHSASFSDYSISSTLMSKLNAMKRLTSLTGDEVIRRPWMASLHMVKADAYDYLLLSEVGSVPTFAENKLVESLKAKNINITSSQYQKVKVYEALLPEGRINFAFTEGLVLISDYAFLIEESINTLKGKAQGWDIRLRNMEEENFRLYVNGKNLTDLNSIFLKPGLDYSLPTMMSDILDIAVSDIEIHGDNLKMRSRFSINNNHDYLRILLEQDNGAATKMAEVLPKHTAFLNRYSVADFESFKTDLSHRNMYASASIDSYVSPWIGQEWAYGICKTDFRPASEVSYIAVQTRDAEKSVKMLSDMNSTAFNADSYQGFNIRFLDQPALFEFLFSENIAAQFNSSHYAVFNDQVIFCNNVRFLKEMIDAYKNGSVLTESNDYRRFTAATDINKNLNIFIQTDQLKNILKEKASTSFLASIEGHFKDYSEMSSIGLSADKYGNAFIAESNIHYSGTGQPIGQWIAEPIESQVAQNTKSLSPKSVKEEIVENKHAFTGESSLKAAAIIAPQNYANHHTGERNTFIQDEDFRAYLIDASGAILWERELDAEIIPPVTMVDVYFNKKNQLLFNTKNKLYVIDRLGRNVSGFPVSLKDKATSGTGKVYYPGDKKLRFFVATEGNKIYAYQADGKPLSGWSPLADVGEVSYPLVHAEYQNRDYLIVATDDGKVIGMNRQGKPRMPSVELNATLDRPLEIGRNSKNAKVIKAYTEDGLMYQIQFDGTSVKGATDSVAASD